MFSIGYKPKVERVFKHPLEARFYRASPHSLHLIPLPLLKRVLGPPRAEKHPGQERV
jgi:hypothetical protein